MGSVCTVSTVDVTDRELANNIVNLMNYLKAAVKLAQAAGLGVQITVPYGLGVCYDTSVDVDRIKVASISRTIHTALVTDGNEVKPPELVYSKKWIGRC